MFNTGITNHYVCTGEYIQSNARPVQQKENQLSGHCGAAVYSSLLQLFIMPLWIYKKQERKASVSVSVSGSSSEPWVSQNEATCIPTCIFHISQVEKNYNSSGKPFFLFLYLASKVQSTAMDYHLFFVSFIVYFVIVTSLYYLYIQINDEIRQKTVQQVYSQMK